MRHSTPSYLIGKFLFGAIRRYQSALLDANMNRSSIVSELSLTNNMLLATAWTTYSVKLNSPKSKNNRLAVSSLSRRDSPTLLNSSIPPY